MLTYIYMRAYASLPFPAVYCSYVHSVTGRSPAVTDAKNQKLFGDFCEHLKVKNERIQCMCMFPPYTHMYTFTGQCKLLSYMHVHVHTGAFN